MRQFVITAIAVVAAGCAQTSAIPLAQDVVKITTSAAPVCGATGAQRIAFHRAAVETIRQGYDRFVIVGGQYQNNIGVVGYTPVTAHTTGSATATGYGGYASAYGSSTTTYSGGQPIISGSHDQGLVVKMFKEGDPAAAKALSARHTLGPKWQEAVNSKTRTCL